MTFRRYSGVAQMGESMRDSLDRERIGGVAAGLALQLEPSEIRRLAAYGELFLEWNDRINLGGRIGADDLVSRHFLDAFAAARFVSDGDTVVDVGSGGGLPIIPLAVARSQARFEGYEPTAKKVSFLRTVTREIALAGHVTIRPERVQEPLSPAIVGRFDVAMSRATFPVARWLEIGRKLVRSGGKVIAFATDDTPEGCPTPAEQFRYAVNRRLLVFNCP